MSNVISITKRVDEVRAKRLQGLSNLIKSDIDAAVAQGIPLWTCAGALATILAAVLAKVDPNLEYIEAREGLFDFVNKLADEHVLQQWEKSGEA